MTSELITEVTVLPDGMDWDDIEVHSFAVIVKYRGHYVRRGAENQGVVAWYSVEHGVSSLSRAGKWFFAIQRFQRWQYRFEYEEALEWARREVNTIKVGGTTWARWKVEREKWRETAN